MNYEQNLVEIDRENITCCLCVTTGLVGWLFDPPSSPSSCTLRNVAPHDTDLRNGVHCRLRPCPMPYTRPTVVTTKELHVFAWHTVGCTGFDLAVVCAPSATCLPAPGIQHPTSDPRDRPAVTSIPTTKGRFPHSPLGRHDQRAERLCTTHH